MSNYSNEIMNLLEKEELSNKNLIVKKQQLEKKHKIDTRMLHIVYVMAWTKVCGGSKIIFEYANRLCSRGHKITIISHDEKPDWFYLNEKIDFIKIDINKKIGNNIPDCDLVVATSWKCIYQCVISNKAPVIFFEQGGSHIFNFEDLSVEKKKILKNRIENVSFIYTVSEYTKEKIKQIYDRESKVIHIAIDKEIFYLEKKIRNKEKEETVVTIIGSEEFKFKNIGKILEAIRILKKKYNIKLNWISQTEPKLNKEEVIINPPQIKIGDILRNTDIYICNSEYESFGLPTLEAMTCGAAIITSDTGGMRDFVKDKVNGLIIKKNNIDDIIEKVEILINNEEYRNRLVKEAIKTANEFNWENSINDVEKYYSIICKYKIKGK